MSFEVAKGCMVPNLDGIKESYDLNINEKYTTISANVSRENIEEIFLKVASQISCPGYLVLEHPTNENVEKELRKTDDAAFHKDVYYMDGLEQKDIPKVWGYIKDHCIDCGATTFGFGSHQGTDEIFFGRYKIVSIYTNEPGKYCALLDSLGFIREDKIKTVWDNFSSESPGSTQVISINDKRIYDLVEDLQDKGLYFSEHRAD